MYTQHASIRCQHCALTSVVIETTLAYGQRMRQQGANVHFMNKISRASAARALGARFFHNTDRRLNRSVVVSDECMAITPARQIKLLKFCAEAAENVTGLGVQPVNSTGLQGCKRP